MICILYYIKKHTISFAAFFVLASLCGTAGAQDKTTNDKTDAQDKIEALKEAYLTRQLDLNPKEAEKFWPVYNQYRKDMKKVIDERKQNQLDPNQLKNADNKQIEKAMNRNFKLEQQALQVRQKYRQEFQNVLPPRKVMKIYKSEKDFNMKLIEELHRRQNNQGIRRENNSRQMREPATQPMRRQPSYEQPRSRPTRQSNPPPRRFNSSLPQRSSHPSSIRPSGNRSH